MVLIVAAARNCRSESIFVGFQIVFLIFPNPALFFLPHSFTELLRRR